MTAFMRRPRKLFTEKECFMRHVEVVTESGCWIWTGCLLEGGYGCFDHRDRKTRTAHRASYEMFKGPIPSDKMVLHSCDVRCCVNPNHLRLGTHSDNMRDRTSRGRTARGDRHASRTKPGRLPTGDSHWNCRLTPEEVREIRQSDESQSSLGRRYGVSVQQIHRVVHRKSWAHLE